MIRLNGKTIEYPVFLAPMAGVTDYAFRRICRLYGASLTVTEMVSAKAIYYNDLKTASLARLHEDDAPCAIQLFGSEPDILAYAAEKVASGSYTGCKSAAAPIAVDINMGCPVKKVVSNKEGSYLMKDPDKIYAIVKAVASVIDIPVTVKIRSGWDSSSLNAPVCAKAAEEGGAALICVHGRTREQMYSPPVDLETIKKVKDTVSIPVIGNGGINAPEDAEKMLKETGCDGVALARGARGNPHLFSQIISVMKGEPYQTPSDLELLELAKLHLTYLVQDKGEEVACREARGHLIWYARGIRGASLFRNRINSAESAHQMLSIIEQLQETL